MNQLIDKSSCKANNNCPQFYLKYTLNSLEYRVSTTFKGVYFGLTDLQKHNINPEVCYPMFRIILWYGF